MYICYLIGWNKMIGVEKNNVAKKQSFLKNNVATKQCCNKTILFIKQCGKKTILFKKQCGFFLNIPKIIWKTDCWGEINSTQNNSLEYKKPHQNRLTFFGTELKQSQQW